MNIYFMVENIMQKLIIIKINMSEMIMVNFLKNFKIIMAKLTMVQFEMVKLTMSK